MFMLPYLHVSMCKHLLHLPHIISSGRPHRGASHRPSRCRSSLARAGSRRCSARGPWGRSLPWFCAMARPQRHTKAKTRAQARRVAPVPQVGWNHRRAERLRRLAAFASSVSLISRVTVGDVSLPSEAISRAGISLEPVSRGSSSAETPAVASS